MIHVLLAAFCAGVPPVGTIVAGYSTSNSYLHATSRTSFSVSSASGVNSSKTFCSNAFSTNTLNEVSVSCAHLHASSRLSSVGSVSSPGTLANFRVAMVLSNAAAIANCRQCSSPR